ncbi:hypothetical protein MC7420_3439 [Coleofasciculus chthonoplastes PCC 7420]|uniref:Uncharacterized protein n=1 Tax=Coleofasciculus chthonoplastes PCC 7420 TaxID=118168 RepID=B4W3B6_9CYAN|nr:hypothetical protein [Coleofasciculus chthonoplastes]EDX71324.1 hypothetical protein MC7420_3439 [Coleofasciculus chthonoplastes PCC 7420]
MPILPDNAFTIQTHEPLPDVIDKLNAHIEAPKTFRWTLARNHAPYAGTISSDGFEVRRIIHYQNSFLPRIRGRFESGSQGTVIRITMRLHPLVIGFLVFWYLTWYSATIPRFYPRVISADGKTALVELGVGGKLVAWDLLSNQQIILQKKWSDGFGYMPSAYISGDGKTAVTIYYRQPVTDLRVWDLTTGMLKAEGRVSSTRNSFGYNNLVLSRDRIIGSTDEGLKVWNLQTAELEATLEHEKMINLVVSSDGKLLAGITGNSENQDSEIQVLRRP